MFLHISAIVLALGISITVIILIPAALRDLPDRLTAGILMTVLGFAGITVGVVNLIAWGLSGLAG